ncbi:MAG: hypothetical protein HYX89_05390 [Chloroflexi bacterium]|nr:hypothetical protein [Chloroflexota bacterium]
MTVELLIMITMAGLVLFMIVLLVWMISVEGRIKKIEENLKKLEGFVEGLTRRSA